MTRPNCWLCGKEYDRPKSQRGRRHCSEECRDAAKRARRMRAFAKWKAKNPDYFKAYNKKRGAMDEAKGPDYVAARKTRKALAYAMNPERQREAQRRHYSKNPESKAHAAERSRRWAEANRDLVNARSAERQRQKTALRRLNKALGITDATPVHPSVRRKIKP